MSPLRMMCVIAPVLAIALLTGAIAPNDNELLDATKRGDIAAVRSLLSEGADPNAARGDGMTALHLAALEGNLEITELLIDARANLAATTRVGGFTSLHVAAEGAHTSVVRALLEAGANPHAVAMPTGATPLHLAAKAWNGEGAIRVLLEHGAAVNAQEAAQEQTALLIAASHGRTPAIRELLKGGADPGIRSTVVDVLRRTVIDRAVAERLEQAIEELRYGSQDGEGRPLTFEETQQAIAVQREFLRSEAIEELLEDFHPDDLANLREYQGTGVEALLRPIWETQVGFTGGMTALLHAAREGHIEAAEALLDGGADIDQIGGDGMSPLGLAALNGQFDLAMRLIEWGADPNIAAHTDGITPLFAVVQTQWANFTGYPQPRAQDGQQTEYLELMKALLEAGADPNPRITRHLWFWEHANGNRGGLDINGATPFFRAAVARDIAAMKLLTAYGADPHIPTMWDEIGMRDTFQEDGRERDDSGLPAFPQGTPNMYPIQAAAGAGALGIVARDVNAVPNNELNAVKYLVEEQGADVNQQGSWGYTAMHYAAVRGDHALIDYLLSKGADINRVSRLGQTPVDLARGGTASLLTRAPLPATVQYMVDRGAEFRCKNTHHLRSGHWCAGAGVPVPDGAVIEPEEPTPPKRNAATSKGGR